MSLVIFFGFATFIFLLGVLVIGVTVYQWVQESKRKKLSANQS
jgi:hypothetical protein